MTAVRRGLARLVTEGLLPYHVAENCGVLLKLKIVSSRVEELPENASEDERDKAQTSALVAILREAVEHPHVRRKSRRVLNHVLPLIDELLGKTIKERRTLAGQDLKEGKTVKPGTIRTYYEPRALERLAAVLVDMEARFRGEVSPVAELLATT
jgi:hypothetical protein